MPCNLLANSWSGLSDPDDADDAEEIWDQTSNFGLESSNDVVTGNFGYQYTRLFGSRQTIYLCYKYRSRPQERFLNVWLDLLACYNDGPISRLISFLSLTTAHSTWPTLSHGNRLKYCMSRTNSLPFRPLTSRQERNLMTYLDDHFLQITRNFKKRSVVLSTTHSNTLILSC